MHITLRPNEKLYINGAVLRVDRKVSIELMNDAVFLLEAHVMLERHATTPLRRLYFIVQLMLIEPLDLEPKKTLFAGQAATVTHAYSDGSIQMGVSAVTELVARNRAFEALKVIRSMLPLEEALIGPAAASLEAVAAMPARSGDTTPPPPASVPGGAITAGRGREPRSASLRMAPRPVMPVA